MRILVADDQELNQLVVTELLRILGVRCDTAQDGLEAVDACRAANYDLVLMDVEMPRMNGREATVAIRRLPHRPVIIGLTAHGLEEEVQACLGAGMEGVLRKPVGLEDLRRLLSQRGWTG